MSYESAHQLADELFDWLMDSSEGAPEIMMAMTLVFERLLRRCPPPMQRKTLKTLEEVLEMEP
jgi:hypothetical protein